MEDINIIDIEASGLHFDSYPIEIAVLIEGKVKSWLIKPEPAWQYWSNEAEALHGITRELLEDEGLEARDVAGQLIESLDDTNGVIYSDAAYWDADWIDTLYIALKQKREFLVESIYDLLDKDQGLAFEKNKARLVEEKRFHQHRAAEDVKLIFEAYCLINGGD